MKVILLSEVKTLGKRGTVVDVADGYANNYLIPRKLATEATKGAMSQLEQQNKAKSRREAEEVAEAAKLAELIQSQPLSVSAKAGGNGKLFGTVTNTQVAEAITAAYQVEIDRHKIEVPDNIKSLGSYPIEVRLGKNIVAKTTVKVVASAN